MSRKPRVSSLYGTTLPKRNEKAPLDRGTNRLAVGRQALPNRGGAADGCFPAAQVVLHREPRGDIASFHAYLETFPHPPNRRVLS